MTNMNSVVYNSKQALPNKLLQEDGSITDLAGNSVVGAVDAYETKPALPNKWINPDGSYSTLAEIVTSMIDTDLFIVVDELPETGESNKIYLLAQGDKLIEYIWVNNAWDPVGMVEFDINNYYTKAEVTQLLTNTLNSAKSYTDTELTDYVKNTDYASASKGGVVKFGYGFQITGGGAPYATEFSYENYLDALNSNFIGKGTLENVITGKQLVNKTDLDTAIQTSITQVLGGSY